jgi:hypothetical protein
MPRNQKALHIRIQNHRAGVVRHAWRGDEQQKQGQRAQSALDEVRQAIAQLLTEADPRLETTAWLRLAGLVAVAILDCVLLGSVVEFIAGMDLEGMPWAILLMRVLGPLAVVAVDLALMDLCMRASDALQDGLGSRARAWFLTGVCLVFSLVMPLGAVALFGVSQGGLPELAGHALLLALVALSMTGHLLILFWRHDVVDALTYGRLWTRRAYQRQRIRSTDRLLKSEHGHVRSNFDEFAADLDTYRRLYPGSYAPAPAFDLVTLRILREIFGPDVVRTPGGTNGSSTPGGSNGGAPGPAAPPPPAPAEPAASDAAGENEYLRTILTQRRREDDSEVKP